MNIVNRLAILVSVVFIVTTTLAGCGRSDEEVNVLVEDSYNQGWYDALDCVKRKGGSARNAADDCEDE